MKKLIIILLIIIAVTSCKDNNPITRYEVITETIINYFPKGYISDVHTLKVDILIDITNVKEYETCVVLLPPKGNNPTLRVEIEYRKTINIIP